MVDLRERLQAVVDDAKVIDLNWAEDKEAAATQLKGAFGLLYSLVVMATGPGVERRERVFLRDPRPIDLDRDLFGAAMFTEYPLLSIPSCVMSVRRAFDAVSKQKDVKRTRDALFLACMFGYFMCGLCEHARQRGEQRYF